MSFYLFIVSSLNHPIYRKIQNKRRKLLEYHNIPYTVLINHSESDSSVTKTITPLEEDEVMFPGGGYNPHMSAKFLHAVRIYMRSFPSYDDIPDYIVRINASVFIYFPELIALLQSVEFPKTRLLAGHVVSDALVVGMIMIFSKDVLKNMFSNPLIYSKELLSQYNDDIFLSHVTKPYCTWYDLTHNFVMPEIHTTCNETGLFKLESIEPHKNQKWYFRIRSWEEKERQSDLENWDLLLRYFYPDLGIPVEKQENFTLNKRFQPTFQMCCWIVFVILIVFLMGVVCVSMISLFRYMIIGEKKRVNR